MHPLVAAAASLAERIKINRLSREERGGRWLWIKQRRPAAPVVLAVANLFFRLAGTRVQALADVPRWQRWEVRCFRELHGDEYGAWAEGAGTVVAEAMPGVCLARDLDAGVLTTAQAAAAGRELRRAHEWHCAEFRGAWSHGDPHTGNFLYDAAEDRARLIDFEVMHDRALPAEDRHADDLLVFLQDVLGRIDAERWLPVACAFLDGYERAEVIERLATRLEMPRGIARLWWAIRTSYLAEPEAVRRLAALRHAIADRGAFAAL